MAQLKSGDKVVWKTSQAETAPQGREKQTTGAKIKGHTVAAPKGNPEYIVKSDKSGKTAARKPSQLRKA